MIEHIYEIITRPEAIISQWEIVPLFIQQSLISIIKILPMLLCIYVITDVAERVVLKNIKILVSLLNTTYGLFAPIFSILPECGFSVTASVLYSRRVITKGTLYAFLIACSDEALPLLFLEPSKAVYIFPVLFIKAIVALIVGFSFDIIRFMFGKGEKVENHIHGETLDIGVEGCCSHTVKSGEAKFRWYTHSLVHLFNIFMASLFSLIALNGYIAAIGSVEKAASYLFISSPLQVIVLAVMGTVSNCFVSVFITVAFVLGLISFPAFAAALISVTGLGLYTLTKRSKDKKEAKRISSVLMIVAVVTGLILYFCGIGIG